MRGYGYRTAILQRWQSESCDALIALHAVRSADSLAAFRRDYPDRPAVVALTGTDVYGTAADYETTLQSIGTSDAAIALTETMRNRLPAALKRKTCVIVQSATIPRGNAGPFVRSTRHFEVVAAGHLRPVKDPLLLARAVRKLPETSRIRATLYGGSMNDDLANEALDENRTNSRFRWLGERPHSETLRAMAHAHVFVLTSTAEGGPAVISEALACGTPILATKIDATIGLLGKDYPGLFPVGDDAKLARLLNRCERDWAFYRELKGKCRGLKALVSPARERRAWRELLTRLNVA